MVRPVAQLVAVLAVALVWSTVSPAPAVAAECPVMAGAAPTLAQHDATVRLRYIQDGMHVAARRARIWTWTWFSIYGALTAGELVQSTFVDEAHRDGALIVAGSSAIGMLSVMVPPLGVMSDDKLLAKRIAAAHPGDDPCALVVEAERLLTRDAKSEVFGKSWLVHAGGLLVNGAVALALGLWLHDYQNLAINFTVGEALCELQFNTQPVGATELLARYRSGNLTSPVPGSSAPAIGWLVAPQLGPNRWGLQAMLVY